MCRSCPLCPRGTCPTAVTSGRPFLPGSRRPAARRASVVPAQLVFPGGLVAAEVDALQASGRCVRGEPERKVPLLPGDRGGGRAGPARPLTSFHCGSRVHSGPSAAVDTFPATRAWLWPRPQGSSRTRLDRGLEADRACRPWGRAATASAHAAHEGPVHRVRAGGGSPGRPPPSTPSRRQRPRPPSAPARLLPAGGAGSQCRRAHVKPSLESFLVIYILIKLI